MTVPCEKRYHYSADHCETESTLTASTRRRCHEAYMKFTLFFLYLFMFASFANAQSTNLLKNPNADDGANGWRVYGKATVEQTDDGNSRFVVRDKGHFFQDVILPDGSAGKYALLIGRVSSERINADGSITGLPYLYGYMMVDANPRGGRILSYLQGQQMVSSSRKENDWVTAWGIFQIPAGTGAIRFFLNQAERKDLPQNGSAARFDDLGLYIFSTEPEASEFVKAHQGGDRAANSR